MLGKTRAGGLVVLVLAAAGSAVLLGAGSEETAAAAPSGHDWPMWGYDAQRRAATPLDLAPELHLQWVLELPEPARAWLPQIDDADKLEFDLSYSPVVAGQTLFVASMVDDSLTAYDTRTGRERWRFYADGPMRLAPVAHEGKVYAVSDDGFLYCIDGESGAELWRFRGGPEDRRLLGNARLINMWPARGGPVMDQGRVYFAASVWPLMGTFIHCLDAATGEPVWSNSGSGATYNLHQHAGADAFGGVAPQGYLATADDLVLVAGGRTLPAAFDRATGELRYFHQAVGIVGKGVGGYRVAAQNGWFYNHGQMYSLEDGAPFDSLDATVLSDEAVYVATRDGSRIEAYAPQPEVDEEVEIENRLRQGALRKRFSHRRLWRVDLEAAVERLYLRAGDRLYGGGADGRLAAIDLPRGNRQAEVAWEGRVEGAVWEMLAADERLFVVTREGAIYCFGAAEVADPPRIAAVRDASDGALSETSTSRAAAILARSGVTGGYALMLGAGDGDLAEALVRQSALHVVVVDPDASLVESLRRRFSDAGLYGRRLAVHAGDPLTFPFPPYLAELIVVGDGGVLEGASEVAIAEALFRPLRPYGGSAFLPLEAASHAAFVESVGAAGPPGAEVERSEPFTLLRRPGPLPGAGQWTHQYADAANTAFSPDALTRAPLGVLWFGGPSNENLLPRHANGPIPHVAGGRLIILGVETISARDVYTGRELWTKELPGIGHPFTDLDLEARWRMGTYVHMSHATGIGANYIGSPYVSLPDGVYVRYERRILRLDPATGRIRAEFSLPGDESPHTGTDWGHIRVWEDLLITTVDPHIFDDAPIGEQNWNALSSGRLVVLDRHSGEVLWTREAEIGFRHNAIVAGGGKVFVIDGLTPQALELMARRGLEPERPAVVALDARTGHEQWRTNDGTFGTWLGYSEEHDVLLQAGRPGVSGDRRELTDEPSHRITAHQGSDGALLWDRSVEYTGPLAIHGETIIPGPLSRARGPHALLELRTGEDIAVPHPLSGLEIPWSYARTYGCSTHNASTHLVTFRSGAAAFADLAGDSGTANLSGFRAGCTNNLVVADGVLSAPDYTRTCTCSYQNQTSLALIHMPEVEMWTFSQVARGGGVVRRLGLNLAAAGNRTSEEGTLWLNYPSVGGPSPDIPVALRADGESRFRIHASLIDAGPGTLPWVAASGIEGLESLEMELVPEDDRGDAPPSCTVRLHFLEPEDVAPGERVFHVAMQGETVLTGLDLVAEAGGRRRPLVKEFTGVLVGDRLRIALQPAAGSARPPLLCGVEVVVEP